MDNPLPAAGTRGAEPVCAQAQTCSAPRWGSIALYINLKAGGETPDEGALWKKNVYHFNYTSNNRDYKIKLLSMVQPGTKVLITTECIINKPQQILEKFNVPIVVSSWPEWLLSVGTGFPELGW